MWIGLLGPMIVEDGGTPVALSAPKQRVVLAALALRRGQVLSSGELAEAVWDGDMPADARVTVHNYILRLRRILGKETGERIRTRGSGYLIDIRDDEMDVPAFGRLHETARSAARSGDWAQTAAILRDALALWRGAPLADIPSQPLHDQWTAHLGEMRLQALEWRIGAGLQLGEHEVVVAELWQLTAAYPFREPLWGLLMLALYRAARQGDALLAFQQARQVLASELGVEPGAELRRLHQQILSHDPALDTSPALARLAGTAGLELADAAGRPAVARVVPRQLPAAVPGFAGRAAELKALDQLAARAAGGAAGQAVVISAIAGTAGIGKTALAVHFAHRAAARFPGGQLYVNLHGFGPATQPVPPAQALRGFLDALGVHPSQIPPGLQDQAGLYRSLLAGKQMLILLDNARDTDQVRPLLPGTPGTLVLVTSRNRLTGLAVTHDVQLLSLGARR